MRRIIHILILALIFLSPGACYFAGSALSAPAMHQVGSAPSDLHAMDVSFGDIRGWFVPVQESSACVLLMHGVRADRRSMIERARSLREAGYSSLLFDFQAHGESPGKHITFGHLESANAHAALSLLRSRFHCQKVAAIGQSLGGAASLLGEEPIDADVLVLESVYPTIEEAVSNRLQIRVGSIGAFLTPLLTLQLQPRLGISPESLRPVDRIGRYHHPVLIMAGTDDHHTPINEAKQLYQAANEPKAFWAVKGAGHVDLHRFSPEPYRERLLGFLSDNL